MTNTHKKAKRSLSTSSSCSSSSQSSSSTPAKEAFPCTPKSWPRFITITAISQHSLPKNPFLVAKTIQAVAGELKTVKRLRDDSLLLECVNFHQAKNLLSLTKFAGTPVLSAPHRTLNSCRGIIRDRVRCLQSLSEDEIAEELEPQGISSVKRFSINKYGKTVLTFTSATLPSDIKAGYHNMRVEVYVPNPLRCYTCQQFGHGSRNCKNTSACRRCCSKEHSSDSCSSSPYCCNCKGDHMPSSKQCTAWIRESAINRLKHERNISFPEARKIYHNSTSATAPLHISYSNTVKHVSTRTVSVQSEITWVNTELPMCTPVLSVKVAQHKPDQPQTKTATTNTEIATTKINSKSRQASSTHSTTKTYSQSSPQSSTKSSSYSGQPPSSSSSSQRSKGKTKGRSKDQSDRLHKGEDDPIKTYNQYSSLGEMDIDTTPPSSRPVSVSPMRGRHRSLVKPPS